MMAHPLRNTILALATLVVAAPLVPAVDASPIAVQGDVKLDTTKVRHGEPSTFDATKLHKVGTVRSTEVYDETDQRKTIVREGIKPGTARYNQLMKEATKSYKDALKQVASDKSLKLIVEEGGISGYDDHTDDVTSDVISAL